MSTERDRLRTLANEITAERDEALDGWTRTRVERDQLRAEMEKTERQSAVRLEELLHLSEAFNEADAEVERMRPVLEAAAVLASALKDLARNNWNLRPDVRAAVAAVDVYNQTPSPSPAIDRSVTE